jgi:hypothetical protein
MKTIIAKLLSVSAMLAATSTLNANEYRHIESLAVQIQNKTRALVRETNHYRNTPNYCHMEEDTREMARLAQHIRDVAHNEGDLFHLQADLNDLDRVFHHVERLFDVTELDAAYGNGHVRGNTRHVKNLLNRIEDCIHEMREDVAAIRCRLNAYNDWHQPRPVRVETLRPTLNVPVYGPAYGSRGISIYGGQGTPGGFAFSNGRIGFNIGF